jgi:isopenicillin N synthase-like dioxygenase
MSIGSKIRVIDINSWFHSDSDSVRKDAVAKEFDAALSSVGLCMVIGHNIPNALLSSVLEQMDTFFTSTTMTDKLSHTHGGYGTPEGGYTAMGVEAVAASIEGIAARNNTDGVESFAFRGEPFDFKKPNGMLMGEEHPFPASQEYYVRMQTLLNIIHQIICRALQVNDEHYFDRMFKDEGHVDSLKLSYYPQTLSEGGRGEKDGESVHKYRYGAHTDYQDITILKPDSLDWTAMGGREKEEKAEGGEMLTRGGLQVCIDGVWVPVVTPWRKSIDASEEEASSLCDEPLIINIGDFYRIWSRGKYTVPLHRVTHAYYPLPCTDIKPLPSSLVGKEEDRARKAVVFFSLPLETEMVVPLVEAEDGEEEGKGEYSMSLTCGQHLQRKLEASNA